MRKLDQIGIRGFRSIRNQTLTLEPLNVLIGANGAGKSNFLETFHFVKQVINQNLAHYTLAQGGADEILYRGREHSPEMIFKFDFTNEAESAPSSYEVKLASTDQDLLFLGKETLYAHTPDLFSQQHEIAIGHNLRESNLNNLKSKSKIIKDTCLNLQNCRRYDFRSASASAPSRRPCPLHDNRFLRPRAENLAACLYLMRETQPVTFELLEGQVRQVASFFDAFHLEPLLLDPEKIQLEWKEQGNDRHFSVSSMSDGTLRFICLATLLIQPKLPNLVLLDEPEIGLHPHAIAHLAGLLRLAAQRTQLIVATQSVTLINQLTPAEIWFVDRIEGASVFRHLKNGDYSHCPDDYTLGDLWETNMIQALL